MPAQSSSHAVPHETFVAQRTHGIAQRAGMTVLRESAPLQWRGLYASQVQESAWSAELPPGRATGIAYCLHSACAVTRSIESACRSDILRPRHFSLLPGHVASRWSIASSPQILHLYVHDAIFQRAAEELFTLDAWQDLLLPQLCVQDPMVSHIAAAVLQLLREGEAASGLLADHWAYLLASRLLSHHSARRRPERAAPTALPPHRWQRLLDYIEARLGEDLSLDALAGVAGTHPTQLWRAFRSRLGTSPHCYILARRLEAAQCLLASEHESIAAIAAQTGFSSQSHLASAFKKHFALTPAQYRAQSQPVAARRSRPGDALAQAQALGVVQRADGGGQVFHGDT